MTNRLIGVEITPRTVRVAVLGEHRGTFGVVALEQRPYADVGELPGLLGAMVPGGVQLTDRVITALPAGQAYVRTLQFPFQETRKILAAVPFELSAQLPVALDDCQVAVLKPQIVAGGAKTVAAAVAKTDLEAMLAHFEASQTPLHILDLMPHALLGGIDNAVGTGLLACLTEGEATLAFLLEGQLIDYRNFPLVGQEQVARIMEQLLAETALFRNRTSLGHGPLLLTGSLATPELLERARSQGIPAELFSLTIGHRKIPPVFVPAVAMALRAGKKVEDRCFNLRQGAYAYRGAASALKKTVIGLGGLLGASILVFALAMGIAWRDKSRQAESLQQQMAQQYRETFPGSEITVDVSLQMQSKLQELRNRAAALGIGSPPQTLKILKDLSAVTERSSYEVEELSCDQAACSLTGRADTFDAVNRIKEQLGAAAQFARVEVAETRKSLDGNRVEFRLRLPLASGGGKP